MSGVLGGLIGSFKQAAAVTFVSSSISTNTTGTSISANVPAGAQTNDLLIAIGISASGGLWAAEQPAWLERLDENNRYTASLTWDGSLSSYTFNTASSVAKTVAILAFRNASWGTNSATSGTAQDPIAASITVPANNSLLVAVSAVTASANTYTAPSGWTLVTESSTDNSLSIWRKNDAVSSGASGTTQFTRTTGTSTVARAWQLSISPA